MMRAIENENETSEINTESNSWEHEYWEMNDHVPLI